MRREIPAEYWEVECRIKALDPLLFEDPDAFPEAVVAQAILLLDKKIDILEKMRRSHLRIVK